MGNLQRRLFSLFLCTILSASILSGCSQKKIIGKASSEANSTTEVATQPCPSMLPMPQKKSYPKDYTMDQSY